VRAYRQIPGLITLVGAHGSALSQYALTSTTRKFRFPGTFTKCNRLFKWD
jgi:hypothetical protein